MLAQPAILLGSIPIDNQLPTTLVLSTAVTIVFGAELVIATLWVHPRRWLYVLLAGCVALGALLMAWSGYYALYGPPSVEPRLEGVRRIGIPTPSIRDPWSVFYGSMLYVNAAIVLLAPILVLVLGILLWRRRRS